MLNALILFIFFVLFCVAATSGLDLMPWQAILQWRPKFLSKETDEPLLLEDELAQFDKRLGLHLSEDPDKDLDTLKDEFLQTFVQHLIAQTEEGRLHWKEGTVKSSGPRRPRGISTNSLSRREPFGLYAKLWVAGEEFSVVLLSPKDKRTHGPLVHVLDVQDGAVLWGNPPRLNSLIHLARQKAEFGVSSRRLRNVLSHLKKEKS